MSAVGFVFDAPESPDNARYPTLRKHRLPRGLRVSRRDGADGSRTRRGTIPLPVETPPDEFQQGCNAKPKSCPNRLGGTARSDVLEDPYQNADGPTGRKTEQKFAEKLAIEVA